MMETWLCKYCGILNPVDVYYCVECDIGQAGDCSCCPCCCGCFE